MNDKQQLAAMGAEMAEQQQQPLCMAKRIEELEAQVRVLTLPEGWQLVPVEPTENMIGHGCGASVMVVSEVIKAWAAMLAAAPKPEAR